jgi:hypothetical protein
VGAILRGEAAERGGHRCASDHVQHDGDLSTAWRSGRARLQHAAHAQLAALRVVRKPTTAPTLTRSPSVPAVQFVA